MLMQQLWANLSTSSQTSWVHFIRENLGNEGSASLIVIGRREHSNYRTLDNPGQKKYVSYYSGENF